MFSQQKEPAKYIAPKIELIKLDNQISLTLESFPPSGPDEVVFITPKYINNDPFKNIVS
jgi:hypothetical protein